LNFSQFFDERGGYYLKKREGLFVGEDIERVCVGVDSYGHFWKFLGCLDGVYRR